MRTVAIGSRLTLALALPAYLLVTWLAAPAQDGPAKLKPSISTVDTVSPQTRKYLESLPDPAAAPAWPAADDLAGWKRTWQAVETQSEPAVQATLRRYRPTVEERKLGGVPVLFVKP